MATNNFDTQVIIGKKNTYTTFQAVLKDGNGDPVSGVVFFASDVKILQYLNESWDVSNIDSVPTEIGSTGVYFFQLNSNEVNPDTESYPVGILVQKGANGDSVAGFFTIKLDSISDFIIDTDTNMSQAVKEILSYAASSTERDIETGTITYKDKSGNPIFTLTPAIDGRTRGNIAPEVPIPQIMNNILNRHFNNPD